MPVGCPELIHLNLNHSKLKTLDLSLSPNLEVLKLTECHDLEELHMPARCQLRSLYLSHAKLRTLDLNMTLNLERLDLQDCYHLVELNTPIGCLEELDFLDLSGCSGFKYFVLSKEYEIFHLSAESQDICPKESNHSLPKFRFSCSFEEQPSSSTENLRKVISVGLCHGISFESFSESICGLQHLRKLTINGRIPEAPKDLGELESLEELILLSTEIKYLPDSICKLKNLHSLRLESFGQFDKLPEDFCRLEYLEKLYFSSATIKYLPDSICRLKLLKSLKLISCQLLEELPKDIGGLECLEELHVLSTRIKHPPDSICMLKYLKYLELDSCWFLEKLPEDLGRLECLEDLILTECTVLKDIPRSIYKMKCLGYLHLPFCIRVEKLPEELGNLGNLRELNAKCTGITHLPWSISALKGLRVVGSRSLLQSCDFTTEIQTSEIETFCHIL